MAAATDANDQDFVRPAKSPARRGVQTVSDMASDAYNRAPDLGISSTVQSAYQNAPDLGVQSTVERYTGYGQSTQQQESQPGTDHRSGEEQGAADGQHQQGEGQGRKELSLRDFSRQKGPSSQDRLGKSQKELGTEYGIPTRAGVATTVSPDNSNSRALEKSRSNGNKPRQAAVPEDFAPEPCPDDNAGTGKVDDVQKRHAEKTGATHSRSASGVSNHQRDASGGGSRTPQSTSSSERKRRSFGEKLRDQVKGEMKILKGSLTNNEATITRGLNIKHGEA